jgi:CBS domain containing-hemolysin-like protein
MEDIVEELLGEIEDEHDVDILTEEEIGDNTWLLSARHDVEHLNDEFNLNLPLDDAYETLGGLIIHMIATLPEEGAVININNCKITIKKVESTRINVVELQLL